MKNKKAAVMLLGTVVFIILVVVFFGVMFLYVGRAGSQAPISEQIYAKQIALVLDKAKPGMVIELDISRLYEVAEKNNFKERVINIDNEGNKVIVRLVSGKGYSYEFFSDVNVVWDLNDASVDENNKGKEMLHLEIM